MSTDSIPQGTLAVDIMGSDQGPLEVLEGVRLAFEQFDEARSEQLLLVGDSSIISEGLNQIGFGRDGRIQILHAPEVIGMEEKPLQSLKSKRQSSMVKALEAVREGHARGILSCGNTGSLMAGGTLKVRPLQGVDRPALATVIPNRKSHFVLIDAGADPESKPANMVQNAILGSHYAEIVLGIASPRVGLLTIGVEEGKGNERVNETHALLKSLNGLIRYQGLIEGFQVFDDKVDVVVCDGFTGNVVLKVCESLFHLLKSYLSDELKKNWIRKSGALLSMGAFQTMKARLNPDQYGAAPLLGLKAPVLKAHGSSSRHAIANAIRIALQLIQKDLTDAIQKDILKANELLNLFPGQQRQSRSSAVPS